MKKPLPLNGDHPKVGGHAAYYAENGHVGQVLRMKVGSDCVKAWALFESRKKLGVVKLRRCCLNGGTKLWTFPALVDTDFQGALTKLKMLMKGRLCDEQASTTL